MRQRSKSKIAPVIVIVFFALLFISIIKKPIYNDKTLESNVEETNENSSELLWELKTSAEVWTTIEVVSTESTGDSYLPSIAVDNVGNIHVAWMDITDYDGAGTDLDIFYKCWEATSSTWMMTEVVSTESTDDSHQPSIAVDNVGNIHVAWLDVTDYDEAGTDTDIFYKCWKATSSTWTTTEVVSTESTADSRYPSIAVDSVGDVHVVWEELTGYEESGEKRDIFYKRWIANSCIWTTSEIVTTESTNTSYEPSIALDSIGNAYVVWGDSTNYSGSGGEGDIFYKLRNTTSNTWTTTEVVSTESTTGSGEPSIAVDNNGNVHVVWYDHTNYGGSGTDPDIFYKHRNATSSTWTTTEVVSTESTAGSGEPSITVDSMGNAHVTWRDLTDYHGSGREGDIFYKRWNATSSTWTMTEVVSTDSRYDSDHPSIAVDTNKNVHIVWSDYMNYDESEWDYDIFYKKLANVPNVFDNDEEEIPLIIFGYAIVYLMVVVVVALVVGVIKKRSK